MPESVLPLLLNRVLGLTGGAASDVSIMLQSADWDIIAMLDSLSSRPFKTEGSMDWVIKPVLPFTRSSPYRVGGSSILYVAGAGLFTVLLVVGLDFALLPRLPRRAEAAECLLTEAGVLTGVLC